MENIHGNLAHPVNCHLCMRAYKNRESLRVHLKMKHGFSAVLQKNLGLTN
jgi:hypothetical protein